MGPHQLALASGLLMTLQVPAVGSIVESKDSFQSLGKTIGVERFEPGEAGKYPAIVILHGAGGMEIGGPEFRAYGRELARRGYVAEIVHYFDQTGIKQADSATIARSFSSWMVTIGDALTRLGKRPDVDPSRIGLLGFSLGSYLSLSIAGHDRRVSAVVEYFGGLPEFFSRNLKRFPPTLILHGEDDRIVNVAEARKIERLFTERKFPFEIRLYPGQGHRFTGADEADAYTRSLAFLDKHVKESRGG